MSPLTLARVIKGPKNRKLKEIVEVEEEFKEEENNNIGIEQFLEENPITTEEEM